MGPLVLLLSLAVSVLHGQQANNPTVGVRALVIGDASAMPERYLSTKKGYEILKFTNAQPSELIHADRTEKLPLFAKIPAGSEKDSYQAVQEVSLPAAAKNVLLLFWKGSESLNCFAVNDNILEANYNNWLMINTTEKPIGFLIGRGEEPFFIKPNGILKCRITSKHGGGVEVEGRAKWDGRIKTFYSTYWPIREGERSIVIFLRKGGRIKVKKISDYLLRDRTDRSD